MCLLTKVFWLFILISFTSVYSDTEEEHGVKYANKCEGKAKLESENNSY